jgi:two-component system, response regulator FlrC
MQAAQIPTPGEAREPLVLLLEAAGEGGASLKSVMQRSDLPFANAESLDRALGLLVHSGIGVVMARCAADWRATASMVQALRRRAPLVPVVVFGEVSDPATVVAALRNGAADFVSAEPDAVQLGRLLGGYLQGCDSGPVFRSAASRQSFELAGRVARTDVSVLITGESGTGKEVVARFIHENSDRASGPFVGVNCAAIPEHMMEATLFGHEKGAFTGAHQSRAGKFEICAGGTMLLDEISEMGLDLQAKLLRVLQEREVERIGAHDSRVVDVRVLATSNRDLREEVREGRFREDLYYRLSVFPIELQPLRERIEDVLPLAEWFLFKHGARMGRPGLVFSDAAQRALMAHAWPGNVRELENAIQRALVLVEEDTVETVHLGLEPAAGLPGHGGLESRVRDTEESVIQQALASCNGRRKDAARALGISERTLRYKLQKLREREELVQ